MFTGKASQILGLWVHHGPNKIDDFGSAFFVGTIVQLQRALARLAGITHKSQVSPLEVFDNVPFFDSEGFKFKLLHRGQGFGPPPKIKKRGVQVRTSCPYCYSAIARAFSPKSYVATATARVACMGAIAAGVAVSQVVRRRHERQSTLTPTTCAGRRR